MRYLLVLLLAAAVWADRGPDTGHLSVLVQPWGEIYCTKECSFSHNGSRTTVAGPKGQVQLAQAGNWLNIQFPGHTARVRQSEGELLVQFGGQNYRFVQKDKRELKLQFPEETVYYALNGGGVRSILGPNGAVTVNKNTQLKTFEVTSEAGSSTLQVRATPNPKKKKDRELRLVIVKGEAPERHPYLVRGVRFEDAGVGIFIPLTAGGPLLQSLDWKATRLVTYVASAPAAAAPAAPVNPLKAQTTDGKALKAQTPANGTALKAEAPVSGTLKAQVVGPNQDPLRTKSANQDPKYPKGPNPLKADIVPRGVDKLQIQEIDPTK